MSSPSPTAALGAATRGPDATTTSPSPPLGAGPGRSMEASGLLPTPIIEAPEPLAGAAALPNGVAAPVAIRDEGNAAPPAVAAPPNGASSGDRDDLLSMLQTLQVEHRSLVEPLVQANGVVEDEDEAAGVDESDASVQELLRKLDEADGAADGLESKLDMLLGRLDGILDASEEAGAGR